MSVHFLSEDKEKAVQFFQFIIKNAKWDVSTADAMELNKHLLWFQGCVKKIEDHVFEVAKVHDPVEVKPEAKKAK
jgi:hypothetical protein